MPERRFPIQAEYALKSDSMPWSIGELFYAEYAKRYGYSQDIETMAQRQGFSWTELGMFAPAVVATLLARAEAAEWRVVALEGALRETIETLELSEVEVDRAHLVHGPEDALIWRLCEQVGYGAVMDSAARGWRLKDAIGAKTVGACVGTILPALQQARRALARDAGQEGGEGE